jgi:putative DNA primase/helicase
VQAVEIGREFIVDCLEAAQVGDARLFAARRQGQKLYDHLRQSWRTYDRGTWVPDDQAATLMDVSTDTVQIYNALIATLREDIAKTPPPSGEEKRDARAAQVERIRARIAKLQTRAHLAAVDELSRSLLATKATEFDQQPHLFAVQNGVLDLASGLFREHRAEDKLTYRAVYGFDPEATCPKWLAFLDFAFSNDQALIAYLARVTGYMLTGYVDKDVLFFHYGKGANGKSTYTGVMQMLLGEMATTIGIEALLAKQADNNFDYKKAMLEGKRVAFTDEIPENRVLSDSAVKALVGGDMITARRPYEKPYNFSPTHKLILVGNHKPEIKGTDHGIWRRIHLIPWLNTIPEGQRRPRHEIHAELRAELPGILNWALRGFLDMADGGGLRPPEIVTSAVKEYQGDSDQLARFMEERTERSTIGEVLAGKLLKAYLAWCEDEGEIPRYRSSRRLIAALKERGHTFRLNGDKAAVLQGVDLIDAT